MEACHESRHDPVLRLSLVVIRIRLLTSAATVRTDAAEHGIWFSGKEE